MKRKRKNERLLFFLNLLMMINNDWCPRKLFLIEWNKWKPSFDRFRECQLKGFIDSNAMIITIPLNRRSEELRSLKNGLHLGLKESKLSFWQKNDQIDLFHWCAQLSSFRYIVTRQYANKRKKNFFRICRALRSNSLIVLVVVCCVWDEIIFSVWKRNTSIDSNRSETMKKRYLRLTSYR